VEDVVKRLLAMLAGLAVLGGVVFAVSRLLGIGRSRLGELPTELAKTDSAQAD